MQSRVAEALALVEAILNEDGPNHDEIIMERSEIIKLERVRPGFAFDITVKAFICLHRVNQTLAEDGREK